MMSELFLAASMAAKMSWSFFFLTASMDAKMSWSFFFLTASMDAKLSWSFFFIGKATECFRKSGVQTDTVERYLVVPSQDGHPELMDGPCVGVEEEEEEATRRETTMGGDPLIENWRGEGFLVI